MGAAEKLPDWPRWMSRHTVATYVEIAEATVDAWVIAGYLPAPTRIGRNLRWDRYAIDARMSGDKAASGEAWRDRLYGASGN